MKTTDILMHTGKNKDEKLPETLEFINEEVNTAFLGTLFTLVSNVKGIRKLIELGGKYLFPLAFALKAADWLFNAWKYFNSGNKNVSKTTDLMIKTVTTVVIGLAVFGTAILGVSMAPVLFTAVIGLDVLLGIGKMIRFGMAASQAKDKIERDFYLAKVKEHAIKTLGSSLAVAAVVVGMIFAPYIAGGIVTAVSLVTVATLVTLGVLGLVDRIQTHRKLKKLKTETVELEDFAPQTQPENSLHRLSQTNHEIAAENIQVQQPLLVAAPSSPKFKLSKAKYTGFFDNRVKLLSPITHAVKQADIANLNNVIEKHKRNLRLAIDKDKTKFIERHIWSEGSKREQKIHVLEFLQAFIGAFATIVAGKEITIQQRTFKYNNVNDLIMQVDDYITHHSPKAYQSFFKDIGGVEAISKQAYKLLVAQTKFGLIEESQPQAVMSLA